MDISFPPSCYESAMPYMIIFLALLLLTAMVSCVIA
ncbi:hypothetical protein GGQ83_002056 [Roseococcus suduntuyensis]|uniref:Uncharacterized protein n=1 Tax=Roseococcus suduntuyensis TaxID=455361 RepID=A0A840ADP8_9PROT|nr:hypothetical protein [Roseococcus suduntuyensis]